MEKGGYKSLLKSFNRSRTPKESTDEGQKPPEKPVASPRTVDELLAGARRRTSAEERPGPSRVHTPIDRTPAVIPRTVDELLAGARAKTSTEERPGPSKGRTLIDPTPAASPRTVDELLAGARAKTPAEERPGTSKGGTLINSTPAASPVTTVDELLFGARAKASAEERPGSSRGLKPIDRILATGVKGRLGRQGVGAGKAMTRKPIAEILENSAKIRAQALASAASDPLPAEVPATSRESKAELSEPEEEPDDRSPTAVQAHMMKARRVLFDFSAPGNLNRTKSLQACVPPKVRSDMLLELGVRLCPSAPRLLYKPKSSMTKWRYGSAFDELGRNTIETDTDDLHPFEDEECQTEEIDMGTMWTQHPPVLSKPTIGTQVNPYLIFLESEGVSSDPPLQPPLQEEPDPPVQARSVPVIKPKLQQIQLVKFAENSTQLMFELLRSRSLHDLPASSSRKNANNASSVIEISRGMPHLNNLAMQAIHCGGQFIACTSVPPKDTLGKGPRPDLKNIVTIWSIHQPASPRYFLRVYGEVTMIETELTASIVVTGSHNGGLNIFDLRERAANHTLFRGVCVRTPSFHSGCIEGDNHHSRIVGIQILRETKTSTQIVSLEKENVIICWSCIRLQGADKTELSVNSAAWSNLRIRVRQVINLSEMFKIPELSCNCLKVWEGDYKYFLVGTNNGFVANGRIVSERYMANFQKFNGEFKEPLIRITQLDMNVKLNLFVAICDDSTIRVFDMSRLKAILSLECTEPPIKILWSHHRGSVFYVAFPSKVAIWDLVASDLLPMQKFRAEGLTDFALIQVGTKENMAIISQNGMKLLAIVPPFDLTPLEGSQEQVFRHYISMISVTKKCSANN